MISSGLDKEKLQKIQDSMRIICLAVFIETLKALEKSHKRKKFLYSIILKVRSIITIDCEPFATCLCCPIVTYVYCRRR